MRSGPSNRELMLPYFAPYFAYVGIASLLGDRLSVELNYLLRILAVIPLLAWAWQWYVPLSVPGSRKGSVVWGVTAGLVGCVLWCVLLRPFIDPLGDGQGWSSLGFSLRLFSATVLVAIFEEIAIRGYVFRLALQWDLARRNNDKEALLTALDEKSLFDVKRGEWSFAAVMISSLVFTLGHNPSEWVAAMTYSLLMSWLWISRGDLLTCIVAHGTTNLTLAIFVFSTGLWGYW